MSKNGSIIRFEMGLVLNVLDHDGVDGGRLENEDLEQRESARSTLRGFIDRIVIPPGDALLQVVGNLGEMLTAAGAPREATAVGKGGCGGVQPAVLAAVARGGVSSPSSLASEL